MTHSASVHLKPFKKGPDSRRYKGGSACIERTAWTNLFLNRLAKRLKPADAADILATAYEAKRPWAIAEVNERLMGKITQPVETEQHVTYRVIYDKSAKDNPNANG